MQVTDNDLRTIKDSSKNHVEVGVNMEIDPRIIEMMAAELLRLRQVNNFHKAQRFLEIDPDVDVIPYFEADEPTLVDIKCPFDMSDVEEELTVEDGAPTEVITERTIVGVGPTK